MCGLAGSYCSDWDVEAALMKLQHRGPDANGLVTVGDAALGHVRLAIQDPTPASDQPFRYGDVALTYVGELWNAEDLREQLSLSGASFRTTGDTEVVAAALDTWGPRAALERLDGMFALAWANRHGVWLARDRYGKVPLYWRTAAGPPELLPPEVTWASERKAWGREGAYAEPVPPGSYVFVPGRQVQPYYTLTARRPVAEGLLDPDPELLVRSVRETIRAAVRRRLVADVPVAFLASGGLDSSLILTLVKEVREDVVAYTTFGPDPDSPDYEAAKEVCSDLGVELREVLVPPGGPNALRAAVEAIEIPMKAQVEIAHPCLYLAYAIAGDGFKVVLSGEGADELFGGYGNMMRRAASDDQWRMTRYYQVEKMARGNFVRTNKAFMRYGVEARLPFLERPLVEAVLGMTREQCPPGKGLLKEAARGLVPDWVIDRKKETFQGASGVAAAFAELTDGSPARAYNETARQLFGALPRG